MQASSLGQKNGVTYHLSPIQLAGYELALPQPKYAELLASMRHPAKCHTAALSPKRFYKIYCRHRALRHCRLAAVPWRPAAATGQKRVPPLRLRATSGKRPPRRAVAPLLLAAGPASNLLAWGTQRTTAHCQKPHQGRMVLRAQTMGQPPYNCAAARQIMLWHNFYFSWLITMCQLMYAGR